MAVAHIGRGSRLHLAHGEIHQAAIAQELRFLHVQFIRGRF